jgi:hypothetical protein
LVELRPRATFGCRFASVTNIPFPSFFVQVGLFEIATHRPTR